MIAEESTAWEGVTTLRRGLSVGMVGLELELGVLVLKPMMWEGA